MRGAVVSLRSMGLDVYLGFWFLTFSYILFLLLISLSLMYSIDTVHMVDLVIL